MEGRPSMSEMGSLPARRRDEESDWHDLVPANCPHCGCEFFTANDDAQIVWDPGHAWDEDCTDRDCHCHVEPVIGTRRSGEHDAG
jgi:hypothetical protein